MSSNSVHVRLVTNSEELVAEKRVPVNSKGQINLAELGRDWNVQNFVWVDADQPLNELRGGWSDVAFGFAAGPDKSPITLTASGIGMHGLKRRLEASAKKSQPAGSNTAAATGSASVAGRPSFVTSMGALSSLVKVAKARDQQMQSMPTQSASSSPAASKSQAEKDDLESLEVLHDLWKKGILTEAEFQAKKKQILGL